MSSEDIAKTIGTIAVCAGSAVTTYFTNDASVWIVAAIIAWFIWKDD